MALGVAVEYLKPWLSIDEQIDRLRDHGVDVRDRPHVAAVLQAVGYYRLTGYLYPFRVSRVSVEPDGQRRTQVLDAYRPGTTVAHAEAVIDFDRQLRGLVMEGAERVEVAMRMRIAYVLGRRSPFAHEDPACFDDGFTTPGPDAPGGRHGKWLAGVRAREQRSDEQFVKHFKDKYEGRMPTWALTEILEFGQLAMVYRGLHQADAEEIARGFDVPTKRLMNSWLASLNYVRNVSAHHARLFNRRLQNAPARPRPGQVSLLDHLRHNDEPKGHFGTYNALAILAYLLRSVETSSGWAARMAALLGAFPDSHALTVASVGAPPSWELLELWRQ